MKSGLDLVFLLCDLKPANIAVMGAGCGDNHVLKHSGFCG